MGETIRTEGRNCLPGKRPCQREVVSNHQNPVARRSCLTLDLAIRLYNLRARYPASWHNVSAYRAAVEQAVCTIPRCVS
jgi:hypothetical protein